jgi:spectinomycin phosphotransferase
MLKNQTKYGLSDSSIIRCLNNNYGIKAVTLTCLPLGADINASIYKAQTLDHKSYFLKLKKGHHHDISVDITSLLQNAGIEQIIPPIKTIHGKLAQDIGDSTLIVYPFIAGQNGFSRPLTDEQWIALGKALRHIHDLQVPTSIQSQMRQEMYSSKWRDMLRSIYDHVETGPVADELGLKLQMFMKKNMLAIRHLVDRAEHLGKKLQKQSPPFVLCHSDIHAGNVLIDENHTLYIVDWDEPIMAPKERDLMFIGGGVGNVWNKPHEEELFYKGYGKTEIDATTLAYYRHERIVEDIAIYSHELLLTTAGGSGRLEMYQHFLDMFAPQGVVEIAFKLKEPIDLLHN